MYLRLKNTLLEKVFVSVRQIKVFTSIKVKLQLKISLNRESSQTNFKIFKYFFLIKFKKFLKKRFHFFFNLLYFRLNHFLIFQRNLALILNTCHFFNNLQFFLREKKKLKECLANKTQVLNVVIKNCLIKIDIFN